MVKEFHARNKCVSFTKSQVQEKEGQLKRDYKMLKAARQQSGSSWNDKRCMVEGSPAMWQNLQIIFRKINKFSNNKASFPLYDALSELYDGQLAKGKHNCTSLDLMEDEEPLRLINSREKETNVVLLEDHRNPREKETQAQNSGVVTEEQRRYALIAKRRQQKEDKKTSRNSGVESMMERYLEMRSKQAEDEVAAIEKECSQKADYSVKKCVSMLSSIDVTKEEKTKAYVVFKTPANREVDGMDVLAVKQACKFAKEHAIVNGSIVLIVCKLM
uniref:Myb/SANT-like domain-containing protein n=1 Tax=Oryza punctata TaxID=4537 RepID=A0A0E0L3Z1_ORYPU